MVALIAGYYKRWNKKNSKKWTVENGSTVLSFDLLCKKCISKFKIKEICLSFFCNDRLTGLSVRLKCSFLYMCSRNSNETHMLKTFVCVWVYVCACVPVCDWRVDRVITAGLSPCGYLVVELWLLAVELWLAMSLQKYCRRNMLCHCGLTTPAHLAPSLRPHSTCRPRSVIAVLPHLQTTGCCLSVSAALYSTETPGTPQHHHDDSLQMRCFPLSCYLLMCLYRLKIRISRLFGGPREMDICWGRTTTVIMPLQSHELFESAFLYLHPSSKGEC